MQLWKNLSYIQGFHLKAEVGQVGIEKQKFTPAPGHTTFKMLYGAV